MLKVINPAAVPYCPATQIPTFVSVALTFDERSDRCVPFFTLLDAKKGQISPDIHSLPQQPPQVSQAQSAAMLAATSGQSADTLGMTISRAAIPIVKAIFGLDCAVV